MNTQNPETANVILGQFERAAPSKQEINLAFERHYNTTTADLWNAVTDPDRLARWFASVSGDLREGGNFVVDFEEGDASQIARGKVTKCRAPEEFRASWNFPGEAESRISVSIHKDNGGALLKLEHFGLSETAAAEYGAGWQAYIEALSADFKGDQARGPAWDDRWSALLPDYQHLLENAR
ncbi:hypothetical protein GCM10027562_09890 [Arthrobacter pigmenti]